MPPADSGFLVPTQRAPAITAFATFGIGLIAGGLNKFLKLRQRDLCFSKIKIADTNIVNRLFVGVTQRIAQAKTAAFDEDKLRDIPVLPE